MDTTTGLAALRAEVGGDVVALGDDGYDDARAVWNADVDRRPAVVVRCSTTGDVQATLRYAVANELEIAVRGGAHSMSGMSTVDDGLVVDLSPMNAVAVDPDARRARVAGGALLGDVLRATQEHGLALPVGVVSHQGLGKVDLSVT